MDLEIKGFFEMLDGIKGLDTYYGKEADKFLDKQANKGMAKVVRKTPVDTGVLRRNWKLSKPTRFTRKISNNTKYGQFVEYPHRTRSGGIVEGKYMLTETFAELEQELEKDLEELAESLLEQVFK